MTLPATELPHTISLKNHGTTLLLSYSDNEYSLSAEFLRVHSPSAQVRGHGKGREILQTGKAYVRITELQTAGNYALKPIFSDGHDSGLYDWLYLRHLCLEQDQLWSGYLKRLHEAAASRFPDTES